MIPTMTYVDNCDVDHPATVLLYIDPENAENVCDIKVLIYGDQFRVSKDITTENTHLSRVELPAHSSPLGGMIFDVRTFDYTAPYKVSIYRKYDTIDDHINIGTFGDEDTEKCRQPSEISLLFLYDANGNRVIKPGVNWIAVRPLSTPNNPKGLLRVYVDVQVTYSLTIEYPTVKVTKTIDRNQRITIDKPSMEAACAGIGDTVEVEFKVVKKKN